MTKLNDTMRILLAGAAQREDGSLLPLPGSLKPSDRKTKALARLVTAEFAIEHETSDADAVHRSDGDLRYGLYATPAGLAAISIADDAGGDHDTSAAPVTIPASTDSGSVPARATKKSLVLGLLRRTDGATLPELVAATDWLPHTTRAVGGCDPRRYAARRGRCRGADRDWGYPAALERSGDGDAASRD